MLTIDQILAGLAALLGQIAGRMVSPEFFVPALIAFFYAKRLRHIFVFSIFCSIMGTVTFVLLTGRLDYAVSDFLIRYVGTIMFIGLLFFVRSSFQKIRSST